MIDIVLGTFFGDEGKGQVVNNLCDKWDDPIVIRFSGGPQCGHTVHHTTEEGTELVHTFSNYGCGTLKGVPTYWSSYCPVNPLAAQAEAAKLAEINIIPTIYYDSSCEIITPWDIEFQQQDSNNKLHGTVGVGFGSTLRRVRDGWSFQLKDCLHSKELMKEKLKSIAMYYATRRGYSSTFTDYEGMADMYYDFAKSQTFRTFSQILRCNGKFIFEGSQGVLLDQNRGIMPHCTPSNTTAHNALELLVGNMSKEELGYSDVHIHMVTRPYITRHGKGPLLTSEIQVTNLHEMNTTNLRQGSLRTGIFDQSLFNHSLSIVESDELLDLFGEVDVTINLTCGDLIPFMSIVEEDGEVIQFKTGFDRKGNYLTTWHFEKEVLEG